MHFLYDRASSVLARVSSSLSLFPSVGLVLPRTFSACETSPLSGSQVAGTLREPGEPTLRGGHVCLGSHPSSCVIWQLSLLYWLTPKIKAALVIEPPPSDLEIQQQKIWNYPDLSFEIFTLSFEIFKSRVICWFPKHSLRGPSLFPARSKMHKKQSQDSQSSSHAGRTWPVPMFAQCVHFQIDFPKDLLLHIWLFNTVQSINVFYTWSSPFKDF